MSRERDDAFFAYLRDPETSELRERNVPRDGLVQEMSRDRPRSLLKLPPLACRGTTYTTHMKCT